MRGIRYTELSDPADPRWAEVERLFTELYRHMEASGLQLPLDADGPEMWLRSAINTTGKFSHLIIAVSDDAVIGFVQGMIRFLPDYLGGHTVGLITHVYVDPSFRRSGAGRELVTRMEGWFRGRHVHSIELQVSSGNETAAGFWNRMGYTEELRQFRKPIG